MVATDAEGMSSTIKEIAEVSSAEQNISSSSNDVWQSVQDLLARSQEEYLISRGGVSK